jgi:hypothetical protein
VQPTLDEARWPAATSVFSAKAPMPSAGASSVPSVRVIFWSVQAGEAVPRTTAPAAGEVPQTARQLRIMQSGRQCVYAIADRFDDASGFVSE